MADMKMSINKQFKNNSNDKKIVYFIIFIVLSFD